MRREVTRTFLNFHLQETNISLGNDVVEMIEERRGRYSSNLLIPYQKSLTKYFSSKAAIKFAQSRRLET